MGEDFSACGSENVADRVTGRAEHGGDISAPDGALPGGRTYGAEGCGVRFSAGAQIVYMG